MTTCLPFEILTSIFEQFDDVANLRNVRTASRTFCAVANPLAFRVLSVTDTEEGIQNLGRFFDVPEIAAMSGRSYCDPGADNTQRKLIQVPLLELEFGAPSPPSSNN